MANSLRRVKGAAIGTAGLGALLAIKIPLVRRWERMRSERLKRQQGNRLAFGKMPRQHQRASLYYRRKQMKDLEQIYKSGYRPQPKFPGVQKRRSLF